MTNDTPEMEGKAPDAAPAAEAPSAAPAADGTAPAGEAPVAREGRREGSGDRPAGSGDRPAGRSFDRGGPRGGGPGGPRGGGGGGFRRDDAGGRRKRFTRRKLCPLCTAKVKLLDYKDVTRMKQFITERGKIRPRRMTGMCAKHQRQVTVSIKRARNLALMPYKM